MSDYSDTKRPGSAQDTRPDDVSSPSNSPPPAHRNQPEAEDDKPRYEASPSPMGGHGDRSNYHNHNHNHEDRDDADEDYIIQPRRGQHRTAGARVRRRGAIRDGSTSESWNGNRDDGYGGYDSDGYDDGYADDDYDNSSNGSLERDHHGGQLARNAGVGDMDAPGKRGVQRGAGGGGGNKNDAPLKLRLDINLDVEVELKASVKGDLTLSLL